MHTCIFRWFKLYIFQDLPGISDQAGDCQKCLKCCTAGFHCLHWLKTLGVIIPTQLQRMRIGRLTITPHTPPAHMHTNIFKEVMPGNSIFFLNNEFQAWGLLMIATEFCIWRGGNEITLKILKKKKSLHVKTDRRKRGMNLHKISATGPRVKV